MADNLQIWNRFADIDPKFTKQITGKDYGGTSPNAHYVIRCLTELFGPVGQGFGWRVVAESIDHFGDTAIHWCRIEFWHTDRANTFEAYGQTKMAYVTAKGFQKVDEDAPKKSLTDAITKAAAQVGVGANIFLGRWDDSKHVAEVAAKFREDEKEEAPFDPAKTRDRIKAAISNANDAQSLQKLWDHPRTKEAFGKLHPAMQGELQKAHTDRMAAVYQAPEPVQ